MRLPGFTADAALASRRGSTYARPLQTLNNAVTPAVMFIPWRGFRLGESNNTDVMGEGWASYMDALAEGAFGGPALDPWASGRDLTGNCKAAASYCAQQLDDYHETALWGCRPNEIGSYDHCVDCLETLTDFGDSCMRSLGCGDSHGWWSVSPRNIRETCRERFSKTGPRGGSSDLTARGPGGTRDR